MFHRRHKWEQSSNPKLLKCSKAGCDVLKEAPYALFPMSDRWFCLPSPNGLCFYDKDEDPCCDDYIYCHKPLERK